MASFLFPKQEGLKTALESVNVTENTCKDFLYFRQLLAESRAHYDDNVNHRLNAIDVTQPKPCRQFLEKLQHIHKDRRDKLQFCIDSLRAESEKVRDPIVLKKEVQLKECFYLDDCRFRYWNLNL